MPGITQTDRSNVALFGRRMPPGDIPDRNRPSGTVVAGFDARRFVFAALSQGDRISLGEATGSGTGPLTPLKAPEDTAGIGLDGPADMHRLRIPGGRGDLIRGPGGDDGLFGGIGDDTILSFGPRLRRAVGRGDVRRRGLRAALRRRVHRMPSHTVLPPRPRFGYHAGEPVRPERGPCRRSRWKTPSSNSTATR
jgi:hypothetical protein